MRIQLIIKVAILLSPFVLFPSIPMHPIHAADQLVEGIMVTAPIGALGVVASGSVEDTLKACLARIPEVASVGQRMLAEQSCEGQEANRQLAPLAPRF
ncbi:MAG TPA: hypothetical protein VKP13_09835 [Nitrospira sp.]|nr:hypothetical protein [Nitrospira sp.]